MESTHKRVSFRVFGCDGTKAPKKRPPLVDVPVQQVGGAKSHSFQKGSREGDIDLSTRTEHSFAPTLHE